MTNKPDKSDGLEKINSELLKELSPTLSQKKRVENVVFSRVQPKKQSVFNLFSLHNMKIQKSKIALGLAGMFVLVVVLATPFIFKATNVGSSRLEMVDMAVAPMVDYGVEIDEMAMDGVIFDEEVAFPNRKMAPKMVAGSVGSMEPMVDYDDGYYGMDDMMFYPGTDYDEDTTTVAQDRAQERDANIRIEIDEFNQKYSEVSNKIIALGGYVQTVNTSVNDSYSNADIQVRVPVGEFDNFMNYLRNIGVILSENISIVDRQSELTGVIKSIEVSQTRITELEEKSVLNVEEKAELAQLKTVLEQDEDTQKELRNDTEFSTVWVYLTTLVDYDDDDWSMGGTWGEVTDALAYVFRFWVSAGMWVLVPLLCVSPIIAVVLVVRYRAKKKASLLA